LEESQVTSVLRSGVLQDLVGLEETVDFEAKSEPYDLDLPGGRYELAKDISALANAQGGYLLIGLETERATDRDLDVVCALRLLSEESVARAKYIGVAKEYIYPEVVGLRVDFLPERDGTAGVLVIHVPSQHPDSGPYLILRVVEDGVELKQIVVGYVQRQGDRNTPLSGPALQQRFRKGSDTVSVRLGRIEDRLDAVLDKEGPSSTVATPDPDQRQRRIVDILEAEE
jgi:predicted HTH transcriptional regulator